MAVIVNTEYPIILKGKCNWISEDVALSARNYEVPSASLVSENELHLDCVDGNGTVYSGILKSTDGKNFNGTYEGKYVGRDDADCEILRGKIVNCVLRFTKRHYEISGEWIGESYIWKWSSDLWTPKQYENLTKQRQPGLRKWS
jgi:hypothetical protein